MAVILVHKPRVPSSSPLLDPLQFAYRANRSVDDAINLALHSILQHLDTLGTYATILFVDFSSAFNTILPALLQDKLVQLNVPDSTCRWITDFLTDRRQHVWLGNNVSDTRTISTGTPQGREGDWLQPSIDTGPVRLQDSGASRPYSS
ncbi:hypothetical protein NQD34_018188 [Periophthalmus magnuspinnatus]|nr:hypothetical protein NQD34_018188 [Periophthalmus magnuspinnatus]